MADRVIYKTFYMVSIKVKLAEVTKLISDNLL